VLLSAPPAALLPRFAGRVPCCAVLLQILVMGVLPRMMGNYNACLILLAILLQVLPAPSA